MTDRRLPAAPSMLPLFARAGVSMLPGASRLPFVGGGGGEIPKQTLVRDDVAVDRSRLAAYDRVCGFDVSDTLPPTYPHMLAFPMHLALMTDGRFPLPAIGLVHVANAITVYRPITAAERLSLRVWATPLEPHPRGRQFTIRTESRVGEELVWEESSTNLKRTNPPPGGTDGAASSGPPSAEDLPATATWKLKGDLGRRYGSVSGDLNPIHVHPLTARLFGFPTAIAHGMWTKARCLAAVGPQLSDRYTVTVAFRRPILLPATVQFAETARRSGIDFGVRDARRGTPHLDGQIRFAVAGRAGPVRRRA
ncbi:MAG TPA: MaoC/PaaZ C-terminal domain-containing protein [Solirubrobacteraceae bacterium]|nr:MaoC/PaaZ C-terminal domain-containing protein [Solirubrobacteraceae bacterium]